MFGGMFNKVRYSLLLFSFLPLSQIVMSPHEQAEEFVDHYLCIMQGAGDMDPGNFQRILEMKVRPQQNTKPNLILCREGGRERERRGERERQEREVERAQREGRERERETEEETERERETEEETERERE